jgi:Tfp pilus assembly protein PilF
MSRPRRYLALLLIVGAAAAVYIPNTGHEFQYDDDNKLIHNDRIRKPTGYLLDFFRGSYSEGSTRFIPNLTFSLDYALFGLKPRGWHLTNLLFHLVNIWLVSRLGRVVLRRHRIRAPGVALLAGAIYAVHPLNSEAVNYCNARPNLVCTTFYLLTVLNFLRTIESFGSFHDVRHMLLLGASLVATLLSKELGATVVLTAPLLAIWLSGERKDLYGGIAPWLKYGLPALIVIALAVGAATGALSEVARRFSVGSTLAGNWGVFVLLNAVTQSEVLLRYLGLALLPAPGWLNVDHQIVPFHQPFLAGADGAEPVRVLPILCALALAAAIVGAVATRRVLPFATYFFLWPLIAHIPTSLVPPGEQMVEYRTYLPMVGVCLLLAHGLGLAWIGLARGRLRPAVAAGAAAGLFIALSAVTVVRNQAWATPVTLWKDTVRKSPGRARAHYNLGTAYGGIGKYPEAIAAFDEAIRRDAEYAEPHNNKGVALERLNRLAEALPCLDRALKIKPKYAEAHYNRGVVLGRMGRLDEAADAYREAIRVNKRYAEACNNLGIVLGDRGKLDEAIAQFREALRLRPDYAEAYNNLGAALARTGKPDDAVAYYAEAIRRSPDYAEAHNNLGVLLADRGRLDEAAAHFEAALRINPDYAEAHNNRGVVLERRGKLDEAARAYAEALRIKPDYAEAHYNRGVVLAGQGRMDEAAADFREALRSRPDYAEAHNNLGVVLVNQGKLDEGVSHFDEALKTKSEYAEAHNNRGVALARQGKADQAAEAYSRAIAIKPDYAEAHNNLGRIRLAQGKPGEAAPHFEQAIRVRPDFAEARRNLEQAREDLEKGAGPPK